MKKAKANTPAANQLTKREREIMNIIIEHSDATVSEVRDRMINPSSYSSIRAIMTIMVTKGLLYRKKDGKKYRYYPVISKKQAEKSAIKELLNTYFNNSLESAVSALLRLHGQDLDKEYLERLNTIIDSYKDEDG